MTGGSDGGGGHTNDSIISSVDRITHPNSGGSVRDDLVSIKEVKKRRKKHVLGTKVIIFRFIIKLFTLSLYIY